MDDKQGSWGAVGLGIAAGLLAAAAAVPSAAEAQDFCWRDSYGRGVGRIPGACSEDDDKLGLLCYSPCPDGMERVGLDCHSVCPPGMRDDGLFCRATEYGRGVGYPWKGSDGLSNDGMIERCEADHGWGECEMCGAIAYPRCDEGYEPAGCNICRPKQPDCGALGLGGQLDLSCAKKIEIGDPGVPGCGGGQEKDAGLCYKRCDGGYDGVGPVCWGQAPNGWSECGMGAAKNTEACVSTVFNQVSSVGQVAAFVASLGSSATVDTAADAGKLAQLKKEYQALKDQWELLKETYPAIDAALDAADAANKGRKGYIAAENLAKAITPEDMARAAAQMAAILDPSGVSSVIAAYTYPKCSKYFKPTDGTPVPSTPAGLRWVAGGDGAANPVIGAERDGERLAICRGVYAGSRRVGVVAGNYCEVGYWGVGAYAWQEVESLTNVADVLAWKAGPSIPAGAVAAGVSDNYGSTDTIYVCRASYEGKQYVGNFLEGACKFLVADDELETSTFEFLTVVAPEAKWVAGSTAPLNTVSAGPVQGQQATVCRANVNGTMVSGMLWNDECDISWGGKEMLMGNYELLTSGTALLQWAPGPQVPGNAVAGGSYNGSPMAVCRVQMNDGAHAGHMTGGSCAVGWAGQSYSYGKFDVLVQKSN